METIIIYSTGNSNRLKFVLDWLLGERLHVDYRITTDEKDIAQLPFFISYGKPTAGALCIPDSGLLWQKGTETVDPQIGSWNDIPTIFALTGNDYSIPFDLFSGIFFLLSRYEEYYFFKPDKHDRYPAQNSLLYKKGWLTRPLVDEWVAAFSQKLQSASGIRLRPTPFTFQPTYDIDMAYSHLHKGVGRIVGAYMRALMKMDIGQISERTQVLKKKQKDPYDSFRWLRQLHKQYDCKPIYFVLSSARTTAFDKNIHPEHPAMMRVIKNLVKEGDIGIHPSYYSGENGQAVAEKKMLENVSGRNINISRQHYIKLKMPTTYRHLLQNGITEDYSMGYGGHLGFRAGTGNSFLWYDIENETITPLRVYPFCFMDTTAHFEAKLSATEAFEKLDVMSRRLQQTGSNMITIFHNFSLGTSSEWKGWRVAYEHFLQEKCKL